MYSPRTARGSMVTRDTRWYLLSRSFLWLTFCSCGGKSSETAYNCPSWSGLSQQEHELQEDGPYYNGAWAPHDRWQVKLFRSYEKTSGTVRIGTYISDSVESSFDMEPVISGEILGRCDSDGYKHTARDMSWGVIDAFYRYKISFDTSATWDPPILEVPADMDVGLVWEIESTQTTTGPNGVVVETEISERREVVDRRRIDTTLGEQEALVVETSRGHRLYYVEGAGLVKGEALIRDGEVESYGGD